MDKNILSVSHKMKKGSLDDDYTLFDDATVLHEFDKNSYSSGLNLKETLSVDELSDIVKQRLLDSATDENKEIVRKTLKID